MTRNLVPFTDAEERLIHKIVDKRTRAENRFPLFTGLLITFGFVWKLLVSSE